MKVTLGILRRKWRWRRVVMLVIAAGVAVGGVGAAPATFVFTSDVHFGINRGNFRGAVNVEAQVVSAAMVRKINALPATRFPADDGLRAGEAVGPLAFVVVTGDIANRQELLPLHIQSAAVSWRQFELSFIESLTVKNARGEPTPLLLVPGNHDVSNAIGSINRLVPERDATSMAEIYNRMLRPAVPRTKETYRFATDRIYFSREIGGAHCVFLSIWPDSVARAWMEADLKAVPTTTPAFIFCHDPPAVDARHFTNPNGAHDINSRDKFENVLPEIYAGDKGADGGTKSAQRSLVEFLKRHRNIVAYFHGHSNWTEFYTWEGPDRDVALRVFRADSPMKGRESGKHETKVAFNVVTFDVATNLLTARECRWNARGRDDTDATPVGWGESRTVKLVPR